MGNVLQDYLTHLNLEYNKEKLIQEVYDYKLKPYDLRKKDNWDSVYGAEWIDKEVNIRHRKHTGIIDEGDEILRIQSLLDDLLKTTTKAVATLHRRNTPLPMHKDNMPCCINIILEGNISPITFKDIGDIYYTCALINVSKYHMVKAEEDPRLLLKYCITDKSYKQCSEMINVFN